MNALQLRKFLLCAMMAGLIITALLWMKPPVQPSANPLASSAGVAAAGGNDATTRPAKEASPPSADRLTSTVLASLTPAERDRVAAEIEKVRATIREMDRSNSQVMKLLGRLAVKLQPLSEEQLDTMYTALTKAAATFEADSAGEKTFREEALNVINEFQTDKMNDSAGKFTLLIAPTQNQLPSAMILSADAVITQKPDGAVEINSSESHISTLNDWNDPDSKSRRRYSHLLQGR